jgi:OPT family oligopeptide transporter
VATATSPPEPAAPLTPEQIERHWYENVYQGDKLKQLTVRAAITGMALGAIMCVSNVYVGLKIGWSMGVAITSCILAWVIFTSLSRMFRLSEFTILENNAMQSAASAAGSMTSAGIVNAIPALWMLNPSAVPPQHILIVWVILISFLGVFLAVPAKRQMINIEQLPFPSGIAAATTLRTLHAKSAEAAGQAKALGWAGIAGALVGFLRDADWVGRFYPLIPATFGTQWLRIGNYTAHELTLRFEGSLLLLAGGALISFRQAWSMLLGAVVNYAILAPIFLDSGDIVSPANFRNISRWSLWIGVPMMVTSGLLLFAFNWKAVQRTFSTLGSMFGTRTSADDPIEKIEVPSTWFVGGFALLAAAIVAMGAIFMQIVWWMGAIAVLATFFLVIVGCRVTGETDTTPVGPMSKMTQLTFGAIKPGDTTVNLLTAQITAGSVSHAGDLLTDLKSGYLLGANPRQQFLAQFLGVLAGGLIVVPTFFLFVKGPEELGTEKWPAPAALVWKAVAELLGEGPSALPASAQIGLVTGAALGMILVLLERWLPKYKHFIPSPTGLGLAFTFNGFNAVSFFIGSVLALGVKKLWPLWSKQYTVPVSSGIIAGESLMGAFVILLQRLFPKVFIG